MNTIKVTRCFIFEMAHALKGYDGKCKNIHGSTKIVALYSLKLKETVASYCEWMADDNDNFQQ